MLSPLVAVLQYVLRVWYCLSVLVYAGLSLLIIVGPYLYLVVCVIYAYNLANAGSNGVTSKIAAAQYTDRVMLVQRETTQPYPVTPEDAASKSVGQATAGVTNDPKKDELTPANDLLKVVTSSRTSFYVSISLDAALHNIITASTVTPANNKQKENENCLPDLVNKTNEYTAHPKLPIPEHTNNNTVMPANVGEFDLPALSSDDDGTCISTNNVPLTVRQMALS